MICFVQKNTIFCTKDYILLYKEILIKPEVFKPMVKVIKKQLINLLKPQ